MNTEQEFVEKTVKRFELTDLPFNDFMERELQKRSFHSKAKSFIQSVIRQRQLLINADRSLKNKAFMLSAIDHLRNGLQACPDKNINVARFFLMNEDEIRILLPGQYPSKRFDKFIALRDQAREIKNRN